MAMMGVKELLSGESERVEYKRERPANAKKLSQDRRRLRQCPRRRHRLWRGRQDARACRHSKRDATQ